jgi:hypothetical protein
VIGAARLTVIEISVSPAHTSCTASIRSITSRGLTNDVALDHRPYGAPASLRGSRLCEA